MLTKQTIMCIKNMVTKLTLSHVWYDAGVPVGEAHGGGVEEYHVAYYGSEFWKVLMSKQ